MKKWLKIALIVVGVLILVLVSTVAYVLSWPDFGGEIEGERLARVEKSAQYTEDEGFQNTPRPPAYDIMMSLEEWMDAEDREPPSALPVKKTTLTEKPASGLRAIWFGHASVFVEIDGRRVMGDPILTDHAFPVEFLAPKRTTPPPVSLDALPKIDVVTISHDHYDHLDMKTVQAMAEKGTHFFVGLGVGAHLEHWEIPAEQIHELDWWESAEHAGLKVHCTPARHYSGRSGLGNPTLWASWVVEGPEHRIYHSGDSGYGPHFTEIGKKHGPIDLAFIKIGDYGNDPAWEDIHMVPESSVKAHVDLGAKTMFPIHWGTFILSYHPWKAPIERALVAVEAAKVDMVTPRIGEVYTFGEPFEGEKWWEGVK